MARKTTKRKENEDGPLKNEARFRMFFERSAEAMSLLDPQTLRYIEVNEAVARLLGAPNRHARRKDDLLRVKGRVDSRSVRTIYRSDGGAQAAAVCQEVAGDHTPSEVSRVMSLQSGVILHTRLEILAVSQLGISWSPVEKGISD